MIAQIRGQLVRKNPGSVIVEVGGIGYQIQVSLNTFYDLPEVGQSVQVHTHTYVREDLLQLYGFSTLLEKDLFLMLISVSGIGPKLAVNILSGITAPLLMASLGGGDVGRLVAIPGIGRKTAERMVLDLQEKVRKMGLHAAVPETGQPPKDEVSEDVISALVNLGYKRNQAEKAVEGVLREKPGMKLEEALRASLLALSAG